MFGPQYFRKVSAKLNPPETVMRLFDLGYCSDFPGCGRAGAARRNGKCGDNKECPGGNYSADTEGFVMEWAECRFCYNGPNRAYVRDTITPRFYNGSTSHPAKVLSAFYDMRDEGEGYRLGQPLLPTVVFLPSLGQRITRKVTGQMPTEPDSGMRPDPPPRCSSVPVYDPNAYIKGPDSTLAQAEKLLPPMNDISKPNPFGV
jgi:hypothetical protein